MEVMEKVLGARTTVQDLRVAAALDQTAHLLNLYDIVHDCIMKNTLPSPLPLLGPMDHCYVGRDPPSTTPRGALDPSRATSRYGRAKGCVRARARVNVCTEG